MRMTAEDMDRFVKELAHKIKTGSQTTSPDRVWEVSESDIDLLQAKLYKELYAPQQDDNSIDFTEWMKDKKGK